MRAFIIIVDGVQRRARPHSRGQRTGVYGPGSARVAWAAGSRTLYIESGSPWENGYIESFNGKLRDDLLDSEDAMMAGSIIMQPLGKIQERNFKKFMAGSGALVVNGRPDPRMQLLSVPEILNGFPEMST